MHKRWRALLLLFALILPFALIELLSAQAARAISRSFLAFARFGFTVGYRSAHISLFERRLYAESLVISPAGADPNDTAVTAKSLRIGACSARGASAYCFDLYELEARMTLGGNADELVAAHSQVSTAKTILSANSGHLSGVFLRHGESQWKMALDSAKISSPILEWNGAVSATAETKGDRWQFSASLASFSPRAPEQGNKQSEPPRILLAANGTSTGWRARVTGDALVYPRGLLARQSTQPWNIEEVDLILNGEPGILRMEPSALRMLGVSLRGQVQCDAITGGYKGEIVAEGALDKALSHRFGAPLIPGNGESQWTLHFEGSPDGARVGWSASPPFAISTMLPPVGSVSVILPLAYPGEPQGIQDLIVTTRDGDYKATGFYDPNSRSLYLSGPLDLSTFTTPGLPVSLGLRGQVSVGADFSDPDTTVIIALENGRVDLGRDFSLGARGTIGWSQKGWTADGSLNNPEHSIKFEYAEGRISFIAKGGSPERSIAHWTRVFARSSEPRLPPFASSVSVNEYELTGVYNFRDPRAELAGFAAVAHPEADVWSSFHFSGWNDAGRFRWKVRSEDTTVAIPPGIRLSGGFIAEGAAQSVLSLSALLEGDEVRLDAEWGDAVLRGSLRGRESLPRAVATMRRLFRIPLSAEAALFVNQTLLNDFTVAGEYRSDDGVVDVRASLRAENPLLGVLAQFSEIGLLWNPQTWSANLTGELIGDGFKVFAEKVAVSPDKLMGTLRAEAKDMELSGLQAVISALGGKSEGHRWLSGTISGTANIVSSGAKAGAVSLEVSEWRGGPVPLSDLWLAGALSTEDLTLSGTGTVSGIPVSLSGALSHPYEPSREGTLVVSADNLPLAELPLGKLPDWLRNSSFTGYVQAIVSPDRKRVSGEGALHKLTGHPLLPRDLSIRLDGDFENARLDVRSDDASVSAEATVRLASPFPVAATFSVDRSGALSATVTDFEVSATGSLEASILPFSIGWMEATASRLRATILGEEWTLSEPATVKTADGKTFSVSPVRLTSSDGELAFSGDIVPGDKVQFSRASLDAHIPLAFLEALLPEVAAEGTLGASLSWGDEPSVFPEQGSLEVRADSVNHSSLPDALRDVFARARLDGQTFALEDGQFFYSDGTGRFDAVGALSSNRLEYFAGSLSLENFRIPYSAIRDSFASAFLRLTGTAEELFVSGDIAVGGGEMRLTAATTPPYFQTPIPIRLNLSVSLSEPFRVTSEGFQSEMTGSVAVRGTADLPLVFGHLTLAPGGSVRVAGKSFEVQSGAARFTGYSLLPEISLRAVRDEPPYTIYLSASGTPPDLVAEFSSSPALTTPSILSVLATGRTLEEIQSITPGGPENFLSLGLQGLLSAGLEERLFDRVSTRSATIGGKKLPVMTLGKAIGNRYFTQYTFDISTGAPEEVSFSYRLHPWELQVVQGRSESPTFTITYRGSTTLPALAEESTTYTLSDFDLQVLPSNINLLKSLQGFIKFQPGDRVTRAQIQSLRSPLKAFLATLGYLAARVSLNISVNDQNKTLSASIVVEPGKARTVLIVGPPGLPTEGIIRRLSKLWESSPTDETFVRAAIRSLPSIMEGEGWQMQSCEAAIAESEATQAVFTLLADPLPRIESVRIVADRPIDTPREVRLRLRNGSDWKPLALQETLTQWAQNERARGYRDFHAHPSVVIAAHTVDGRLAADVTLTVTQGPLFQIREVSVEPPEARSEALHRVIDAALASDRSASLQNILSLRQTISRHFREEGYADVYITVREKPAPNHSLDLIFRVDAGQRLVVSGVFLEGSLSASERAHFSALLSPFTGRVLSPSLEAQIRKLLASSGFPSAYEIRVRRGETRNNAILASLHIRLVGVTPLAYSASLGYGSASGPSLTLSGIRQGVLTPWQSIGFSGRLSRDLKNADLTFNDPRFQFRDYTARLRLFAERAVNSDLVIHTRLGGIEVTRAAEAARSQTTGSLQIQRLSYSGGTLQDPDTALVLNLAYLRDRRDSMFNPRRGDLFSVGIKFGQDLPVRKPVFGRASLHFVRALPVAPTVSLFSRVYAGYGFNLPLGERFFYTRALGVRGFNPDRLNPRDNAENFVGGQAIALAGLEARWRANKNWGALAFIDSGGLFERPSDFRLADIALSAGAGFFYISPLGPIRLEYQIPLKPEDRSGKNELFLGFAFAY